VHPILMITQMKKQTSDAKRSLFGKLNQATLRYSRDIAVPERHVPSYSRKENK